MKKKSGFCLGVSGSLWINILFQLQEKHEVDFSFISGGTDVLEHNAFKHILSIENLTLYRGGMPAGLEVNPFKVDETILSKYREEELICLEMSDRMDQGYSFSRPERERLYIQSLNLWLSAIELLQPEFIIMPDTPHSVVEYVLYAVAKKSGIKVLMFSQVPAIERVLAYSDYKNISANIKLEYEKLKITKQDVLLSEDLVSYVEKYQQGYSAVMPKYLKKRLQKSSTMSNFEKLQKFSSDVFRFKRYAGALNDRIVLLRNKFNSATVALFNDKAPGNYLKMPYQALESTDGLDAKQWRRYKNKAQSYKEMLLQEYKKYSSSFGNLKEKYIYVPLHYQPERTTCPEGGRYSNQILLIRVIASCLPENWKVVVKENPSQLLPKTLHGERARYPYYYEDISAIPNVKLINMDTDPFALIKNCEAVATITGTTGWEALLNGKPVLCFGYAWYQGCEGVFNISDLESCQSAINSLLKGIVVPNEKVLTFLYALDKHSFKGFLNLKRYEDPEHGEQQNYQHMLPLIRNFIQTGEIVFTKV